MSHLPPPGPLIPGLCHPSQCGLVAAHAATAAVLGTTGGVDPNAAAAPERLWPEISRGKGGWTRRISGFHVKNHKKLGADMMSHEEWWIWGEEIECHMIFPGDISDSLTVCFSHLLGKPRRPLWGCEPFFCGKTEGWKTLYLMIAATISKQPSFSGPVKDHHDPCRLYSSWSIPFCPCYL